MCYETLFHWFFPWNSEPNSLSIKNKKTDDHQNHSIKVLYFILFIYIILSLFFVNFYSFVTKNIKLIFYLSFKRKKKSNIKLPIIFIPLPPPPFIQNFIRKKWSRLDNFYIFFLIIRRKKKLVSNIIKISLQILQISSYQHSSASSNPTKQSFCVLGSPL